MIMSQYSKYSSGEMELSHQTFLIQEENDKIKEYPIAYDEIDNESMYKNNVPVMDKDTKKALELFTQ